jgi:hypothetical protein
MPDDILAVTIGAYDFEKQSSLAVGLLEQVE